MWRQLWASSEPFVAFWLDLNKWGEHMECSFPVMGAEKWARRWDAWAKTGSWPRYWHSNVLSRFSINFNVIVQGNVKKSLRLVGVCVCDVATSFWSIPRHMARGYWWSARLSGRNHRSSVVSLWKRFALLFWYLILCSSWNILSICYLSSFEFLFEINLFIFSFILFYGVLFFFRKKSHRRRVGIFPIPV